MKILVTGITGQLGHDVMKELARRGHTAVGTVRCDPDEIQISGNVMDKETPEPTFVTMDLTDRSTVLSEIARLSPNAVIHCAAWTAVDAAEDPENRETVYEANVLATRYIAEACAKLEAKLLYVSTDYVFDGSGTAPRDPDDKKFDPLNIYGKSKLDGEYEVVKNTEKYFIVRTSWVFGQNGSNFVKTMLKAGRTHDALRVVNDQIGTPTYTHDLARLLVDMIETEHFGFYHATNEGGYISWYDFTREIFRQTGINTNVIPVTTAEYGLSRAARPLNSRLDKSKLTQVGFLPLPDWKDALKRYLKETGELQ